MVGEYTCKTTLARKLILGTQVLIVLIFIGFAIAALVIFFGKGAKGDIDQYIVAGARFGTVISVFYLIFQLVSKLESKYKDRIRSQKLNEIHYMLARSIFKSEEGSQHRDKIEKFNESYLHTLCEDNFTTKTGARIDNLDKLFKGQSSTIKVSDKA